jgi:hypothetical protein
VADVLVDGVSKGAMSSYTFTNVKASHTIRAMFAENEWFIIEASAGANGSISPFGRGAVLGGTNLKFAITPAAGYRVADVAIDGESMGALTSYIFNSIQEAHTIIASFTLDVYTIRTLVINWDYSFPINGHITVNGAAPQETVNPGASITYAITPNEGYKVYSVLVDGAQRGGVTSFTFSNIQSNHTIEAYVRPITYIITANPGAGGSITPVGTSTFNVGASQTYIVTANAGYHITDVTVDGMSQGTASGYSFTNIQANHTISVTFAANTGR